MRALSLILLLTATSHADKKKRIAGVVTVLAGAAFVVAGAALGNQATSDSDAVSILFANGGVWNRQAQATEAEAKHDQVLMAVLYPIGGALVIAGITTAIVGWWQDKHNKISITPTRDGAAATWSVSF